MLSLSTKLRTHTVLNTPSKTTSFKIIECFRLYYSSKFSLKMCESFVMVLHSHYYNILILCFETELTRFNSFEIVSSYPARGRCFKAWSYTNRYNRHLCHACLYLNDVVKGRFHTFIYTSHLYYRLSCKNLNTHILTHARASHHNFINVMAKYEICMNKFQSFNSHAFCAYQQNGIYYLCSCT